MENSIEAIVEQERRKGWFISFDSTPDGWTCRMKCGVDIAPANIPRPITHGPTQMVALVMAIRERDQKFGKQPAKESAAA